MSTSKARGCTKGKIILTLIAVGIVMMLAGSPSQAEAHAGPPLKIGTTENPDAKALARIVLAYLRERVGLGFAWEIFPNEAALDAAYAEGKVHIAVGRLAGSASSELVLSGLPGGVPNGERLGVAIAPWVLADEHYGLVAPALRALLAVIAAEDLATIREAEEREGGRGAAAAARMVLEQRTGR